MARRSRNMKRSDNNNLVNRNPLTRPQPRIPRPRLNFDGTTLLAKRTGPNFNVATLTPSAQQIWLVDGSFTGSTTRIGVTSNTTVPSNYSEYVFHSVSMEWFPTIGPSHPLAGAQIVGCYIDNPEQLVIADASTTSSLISRIRATKNFFFCNAWERKTFNIPLTRRLKSFNVNTSANYADPDVNSRSVQGAILTAISNVVDPVSTALTLGFWVATYKIELRNLTDGLT